VKRALIIGLVILAVLVLLSVPVVGWLRHQQRIDSNASSLARLTKLEHDLARAQSELAAVVERENRDRVESAYQVCLANLATWNIADSFVLYETDPGKERDTLLGFLPPQPVCVKP